VTGKVPWRRRPRARLDVAHHRLYLVLVWLVVLLLWAGGVSVSTGLSGTAKLLGALGIAAGVGMAAMAALYLHRPVEHRPARQVERAGPADDRPVGR
jgi:hypothetical protein